MTLGWVEFGGMIEHGVARLFDQVVRPVIQQVWIDW